MTEDTQETTRAVAVVDDKIDSKSLFNEVREVIITHGENEYKLKITSNNKLILTK